MGLLYSVCIGNRITVCSVSMVFGLETLVDTPYLAGFVVALGGSDNPLGSLLSTSH